MGRSTQSQSLMFLSSELEITVVALLTTLTCDQLTQSVVYLQDTDIIYGRLLSARERVQFISLTCSSRDHEAICVDRKCRGGYPFIHIP